MYKIIDWAGNILTFKGKFERPSFTVPKTFEHDDAASDYIHDNLIPKDCSDSEYESIIGEYFIIKV